MTYDQTDEPKTHYCIGSTLMFLMLIPLGGLVLFGLGVVLSVILVIAIITNPSKGIQLAYWLAPIILFSFVIPILIRLKFRIQARGLQILEEGIKLVGGKDPATIRWGDIVEIRHLRNHLSVNKLRRKDGESREDFLERWSDDSSMIVLIGNNNTELIQIRGSAYIHYAEIRDEISRRVENTLGRPARNMDNERARALLAHKKYRAFTVALAILLLIVNAVLIAFQIRWDSQTTRLDTVGVLAQASVLSADDHENSVSIRYEYRDNNNSTYTSTAPIEPESWLEQGKPTQITIHYDPDNPNSSRPTDLISSSAFADSTMRIISYFALPPLLLLNLYSQIRSLLSKHFHYKTDRYTAVKLGDPKVPKPST